MAHYRALRAVATCRDNSRVQRHRATSRLTSWVFVAALLLKGAVPLLLGSLLLPEAHGSRLYGVVVVVVLVSVLLQGTAVPALARRLGVGIRDKELREPYPQHG